MATGALSLSSSTPNLKAQREISHTAAILLDSAAMSRLLSMSQVRRVSARDYDSVVCVVKVTPNLISYSATISLGNGDSGS